MMNTWLERNPTLRAVGLFTALCLITALLAWLIRPLILHIVFAVSWYILLHPVTARLVHWGFTPNAAVGLVLLGLLILSVLSGALFLPLVLEQLSQLQTNLPNMLDQGQQWLDQVSQRFSQQFGLPLSVEVLSKPLVDWASGGSKNALLQVSNMALTLVSLALIVPLLAYFLLRDYRSLRNHVMQWVPNSQFELAWLIYYRVAHQLQDYVRGVLVQSGIMALITTTGFAFFGIEMAVLLGLLTGLLNIIPYLGPILAMIPPCLIVIGSGADPSLALAAIGVILFAQLVDNTVVVPAFIANVADLHPLVVILGVAIFGHFFGFIGMVLAIPALFSAKILFSGLVQGMQYRQNPV
ncbi:permease, putative [gamma proteobacterium HTCC5015]|nr:permease, putative [gamma proteobacterium HTCC5015]